MKRSRAGLLRELRFLIIEEVIRAGGSAEDAEKHATSLILGDKVLLAKKKNLRAAVRMYREK